MKYPCLGLVLSVAPQLTEYRYLLAQQHNLFSGK